MMSRAIVLILLVALSWAPGLSAQDKRPAFRFDFGPGSVASGYTQVLPGMSYNRARGFGFEPGARIEGVDRGGADALRGDFCTAAKPFYFSVAVPEGNYRVTVTLGDLSERTRTTVKAELRRLMLEDVRTESGRFETRSFVVNVRIPKIAGGGEVRLKDREKTMEAWAWDDKLTLEFNDERPCVCALEVTPVDDVPTVYLLGDSTVCDQPREPYASWGQMLPRFFGPGVAIANHAESGEALRSSRSAGRLDKVLSTLRPGDYLFLQFGHNDMKSVDAASYKSDLHQFATAARRKGANVVLITPVQRRSFKGETITNSLRDFPDAVRQLAREENLPFIDLHAQSKTLYEALGSEKSAVLFKSGDGTHHNNFGSYELARCVVEGIKQARLELTRLLAADVTAFDPSRPDPVVQFRIPASPLGTGVKPDGD